ncbi:peroxisomal biogenesis factor 11 [Helicosporidium sp. ATCC 50920]|nr:peroxisomal biogenesis factor 11 [Helicosporidium sp. ATCC 50920]|eukprot:KDD73237.1 peroxisomal biogenesis factor 11 [Helicosporidium sp. ATCC 50920]
MAETLKVHAKVLQQLLDKFDGRDKLLATVQYAAMLISAGEAGDAKKVQASVATARKVFRILRPLEALNPVLQNPHLNADRPLALELLAKIKPILMALYFAGDHVVWAQQAGLMARPELAAKARKASLWGWFGGSMAGLVGEVAEVQRLLARRAGEKDAEYNARQEAQAADLQRRLIVILHACLQAALAVGLLGLRPWKPRTIGAIGTVTSALNCYMLYPALKSLLAKVKADAKKI